ncbi:hypothetical protein R2S03_07210 [Hafnia alvei]|uniref:hypothetical protein n=2 Tax=Gammaproteobacteria TaxID=1236 RepID=UPI000847F109|nr:MULTISPECIES: hypothetical protein [Enterobacterales]ODQ04253.1 hypothetical protein BGK50_19395 [Shigella sp. FC130]WOO50939.1 hypothetical protein R2S03_07210 [Hafnia alvei]WPF05411.1 hypothetical protein SB028_06060 [Proteus vulgaris]
MFEEIKADPVWVPNHFPDKGRLKLTQQQIEHNYKIREEEKRNHSSSLASIKITAVEICILVSFSMAPIIIEIEI